MKKILVIEDWPNFVGEVYERASKGTIQGFLLEYELKDVVEFESKVSVSHALDGGDDHFILSVPNEVNANLRLSQPVRVFIVKKKEEKR